jgi:carboxypeptidase Taq
MAEAVGLDFDSARLDESPHPFSGGIPDDSRITTRYSGADYTEALMGVLHEAGHAMYERGLPREWRRQPVGRARGMALHESQSLLIEMQVCRSRTFFDWAAPVIAEAFGASGPAWAPDNLHRLANLVRPGFIRVDADEVTYPAHIVLRTRLERALIAGNLAIADLPGAWNDGMTELLNITPPEDRLGCLQDIHWPGGDFGYFPTYTLGAMAAAQLAAAARAADPDIMAGVGRGNFTPLMAWLGDHVHGKGSLLSTDEILHEATGSPLGVAAFEAHLKDRYLGVV